MKKETFSGTKLILCKFLLVASAGLTGCTAELPGSSSEVSMSPVSAEESGTENTEEKDDSDFELGMSSEGSGEILSESGCIKISFDFERMSSTASNQIAVWIEDADGNMVKTILVTSFTAARRGYRNREMSLSHWVDTAEPESMSDDQTDAISSATPGTGHLTYSWDFTDQNGSRVPDGTYTVYVEGTLYWQSNILFSASLDTAGTEIGDLKVEMQRSDPDSSENEYMLRNVRITVTE